MGPRLGNRKHHVAQRPSRVSIRRGLCFAVDEVLNVDLLSWARCSVESYV